MRNYQLKITDFIYPQETPVRIITLIAAAIILVLVFVVNKIAGLLFLVSIGLLFLALYQMSMSTLGSCVKVTQTQFANIYSLAQIAADRLDMDMPVVYIQQNPIMNAYATGFWGNYFVVLHSSIVDALSEEELLATIGHEFTHIKANHVIITNLTMGGVGLIQAVWWLQMIIKYVFLYLSRCQEYTCDRGGLIACGSIQAVVTENVKFSIGKDLYNKIDIMQFYRQVLELDSKPLGILGEVEATHPLTVKRIRQAVRFYRSEKYQRIAVMQGKMGTSTLQGSLATGDLMQKIVNKTQDRPLQNQKNFNGQFTTPPPPVGFCKKCGTPRKSNSRFCSSCGVPYDQVQDIAAPFNNVIPIVPVEEIIDTAQSVKVQMAAAYEAKPESSEKICIKCGCKNQPEAMFCTECGEKI